MGDECLLFLVFGVWVFDFGLRALRFGVRECGFGVGLFCFLRDLEEA